MENCSAEKRSQTLSAPLLTALFAVMALIAAMTAKLFITDAVYAPVTPDYSAVSPGDTVALVISAGRSAAIQMLLIFASGFTPFASAVSALILTYRGICIGYTSAAISGGIIDPISCGLLGIPTAVLIPALYFLSTVPIIAFGSASVSYSRALLGHGEKTLHPRPSAYFLLFVLLSGVAVLISVLISLIK